MSEPCGCRVDEVYEPGGETGEPSLRIAYCSLHAAAPKLRDAAKEIERTRVEILEEDVGGDAPGHSHDVRGIWDSDNGDLAGKPCEWCAAWTSLRDALAEVDGRQES